MTVCYDSGVLQAFLDAEITGHEKTKMEKHLLECGSCREALERLRKNQSFTDARLAGYLHSLGRSEVDTGAAWSRFRTKRLPARNSVRSGKGVLEMFSKYRLATTAAVMVLALAVTFSFGSVRTAASELLTIFRVEKVQTINITPSDISRMEKAIRDGAGQVDVENFGKMDFNKKGASGKVTREEARSAVDFDLSLPSALPDGYSAQEFYKNAGGTLNLTLDTRQANEVLKALGSDKLLPEELDGKTFSVLVPDVIDTRYRSSDGSFTVSQGRSPELRAPGSDVNAIRDALLALPFLPESLRNQLAAIDDWQHTILVPNVGGSSQEVKVKDFQAVFMTPPPDAKTGGRDLPNSLIWQKDGVVYAVTGSLTLDQARTVAESMN